MNRLPNNKGSWCKYRKDLFCQEGYCEDCEINKKKKEEPNKSKSSQPLDSQ
jgi:hypothetical protein